MRHFSNPLVPILLAAIFALAGWLGGPANGIDVAVVQALMRIREASPALTDIMIAITWLGSAYATLGFSALVAIGLAIQRAHGRALLLVATVALERLVMEELKILVGRARPDFDPHPVVVKSLSFPSGHAA